ILRACITLASRMDPRSTVERADRCTRLRSPGASARRRRYHGGMTNAALTADGDSDDHVVRAITGDDNFRVNAATTSETVRAALEAQRATGNTAKHFADLITGTILIRETMSPTHRV